MNDVNGIIDDVDGDSYNEDTNTYDEESGDKMVDIPRINRPKPRQAILSFGTKARARFVENDENIYFEKRVERKLIEGEAEDKEDAWKNDGYYGYMLNLVKYVLSINNKEKILHKKQIHDLEEIKEILIQSDKEMKQLAKEIVEAINNNSVVKEISNEALDRSVVVE